MSTGTLEPECLTLEFTDLSEQKVVTVRNVQRDTTIQELLEEVTVKLRLARQTPDGQPLTYHARLEREGRHLQSSEKVGEALLENDRLSLHHAINAGGVL